MKKNIKEDDCVGSIEVKTPNGKSGCCYTESAQKGQQYENRKRWLR